MSTTLKTDSPKLQALRQAALDKPAETPSQPRQQPTPEELAQQRNTPAPEQKPEPKPTDAPTNLRALAQAKEAAEREPAEARQRLQELEARANAEPDPKVKTLLEEVELRFENDPEKLLARINGIEEKETEWQQKLREADERVKRISLVHSEDYQRHVTQPIQSAKDDITALLDGDNDALTALSKIIHDDKGQLKLQQLGVEEKKEIRRILTDANVESSYGDVNSAIRSLQEATRKGLEYVQNHEKIRRQEEEQSARAKTLQAAEMERQNKLVMTRMKAAARNEFPNVVKDLPVAPEIADDIFQKVHQDLEDTMAGHKAVNWQDAYTTNALAEWTRRAIADGTLAKALKALETVSGMKRDGDGSTPRKDLENRQPDGRPGRVTLGMLEQATGVKTNLGGR